jgi:hypothetical protein
MGSAIVALALGVERLLSAILTDGIASYASTRFVVAVVCLATGGGLLALALVTRHRARGRRS